MEKLLKPKLLLSYPQAESTDLPAFYADWFFKLLDIGYSAWTNPLTVYHYM